MDKFYTVTKRRQRTDFGSDHELLIAKIRLIIFFADKDEEALYSQQKQDQELTVAQIMNYLWSNSDLF